MTDEEFGRMVQELARYQSMTPEYLGSLVRELFRQAVRDVLNTPLVDPMPGANSDAQFCKVTIKGDLAE